MPRRSSRPGPTPASPRCGCCFPRTACLSAPSPAAIPTSSRARAPPRRGARGRAAHGAREPSRSPPRGFRGTTMTWLTAHLYDLLRGLHIIAVIAWMAGQLYLPRLYVYHTGAAVGSELDETFKVMEAKLLRI